MDKISLKGMAFYGCHGVLPEEARLGQRFYVDADLFLDLGQAARSDALGDTVNYAAVYDRIRSIMEGERCALIERLAGKILDAVMEEWPEVERMAVTVHKPEAPVAGVLRDVSVTIEKKR